MTGKKEMQTGVSSHPEGSLSSVKSLIPWWSEELPCSSLTAAVVKVACLTSAGNGSAINVVI